MGEGDGEGEHSPFYFKVNNLFWGMGSYMSLSEADTKAKLIDPALHQCGWKTNRIVQACDLVGIKVLDHIIIGKNKEDYFSFTKEGLIK